MQSISSSKKALLVNTNIKIEHAHLQQQQLPHPVKSKQHLHKYHTNSIFSDKRIDNNNNTNTNNTKQSLYQIPLNQNKSISKQIQQTHKLKLTTNNNNNNNNNIIKRKVNNKVMKFLSFNNNRTVHNSNTNIINSNNTVHAVNLFSPVKKKTNNNKASSKHKHVHYYHNALSLQGNNQSSSSSSNKNTISYNNNTNNNNSKLIVSASSTQISLSNKRQHKFNIDVFGDQGLDCIIYNNINDNNNNNNQQLVVNDLIYQPMSTEINSNTKYNLTTTSSNINYSQTYLNTNNNKTNAVTTLNSNNSSKLIHINSYKKIENCPSVNTIIKTNISNTNTIKSYLNKTNNKHTSSQRYNTLKYTLNYNTNNTNTLTRVNSHSHSNSLLLMTHQRNNTLTTGSMNYVHGNHNNNNLSFDNNNSNNNNNNSNHSFNLLRNNNNNKNSKNKIHIKVNRKMNTITHNKYNIRKLNNNNNTNHTVHSGKTTFSRSLSKTNTISLNKRIYSLSVSNTVKKHYIINANKITTELTPKQFLYAYHKHLTMYEINEIKSMIKDNNNIYYYNNIKKRKKQKIYTNISINNSFHIIHHPQQQTLSNDHKINNKSFEYSHINIFTPKYDDEEGDYIIKPGDHLHYRYEIISLLGKGSYGEAVKCLDHKTNEYVCIKIIKANPNFQSQASVEIEILEYIINHDKANDSNIVRYYNSFIFRNHLCLVFELLDINLYDYLKIKNFKGLNESKIRNYTRDILFSLLYLKKHKIIHCDLKPENILTLQNNKNKVKVIDFGSSCFDKDKIYFYIQSRFYRAPEILLEQGYSLPIDMWSLGCILCELYTGFPIFPGENELDQLNYIMEYLDVPSNDYINISRRKKCFFDENNLPYQIPNSDGVIRMPNTKTFNSFMCGASKYFVDFVERCLVWYPEFRISPEDALMHNFVICEMDYDELCMHKQKIKRIQRGGDYESKVSKGNCGNKMYTNITSTVMVGNGKNKRSSYSYEKKKMMVFHKGLKRKRNSDNDNNTCGNNTSNLYAIPSARGKEGSCNGNYMKINKIKNKK